MKLNTGIVTIPIERDEEGVIYEVKLNANDLTFVDNFYSLYGKLKQEIQTYDKKVKQLESDTTLDDFGVPVNAGNAIKLAKDLCNTLFAEIDTLLGDGTSQAVFNGVINPYMIVDFFEGISPYIEDNRNEKIQKYTGNREQRRQALK